MLAFLQPAHQRIELLQLAAVVLQQGAIRKGNLQLDRDWVEDIPLRFSKDWVCLGFETRQRQLCHAARKDGWSRKCEAIDSWPELVDAILDAALRLLADGGLTAFTTDRLASEARVSKTSIYRRWSDKKAVFRAVMQHWGGRAHVEDQGDFAAELDHWYADRQAMYNQAGFRQVAASLLARAAARAAGGAAPPPESRRVKVVIAPDAVTTSTLWVLAARVQVASTAASWKSDSD
ncbi:helix-turn-helix domain-containing protein, partial [Marinovum algicola]|uniref:helix-turn-helix domain-containing protein n=1 Tax=Marinovum algicola TaxID=42444 RepID=UPI003D2F4545